MQLKRILKHAGTAYFSIKPGETIFVNYSLLSYEPCLFAPCLFDAFIHATTNKVANDTAANRTYNHPK